MVGIARRAFLVPSFLPSFSFLAISAILRPHPSRPNESSGPKANDDTMGVASSILAILAFVFLLGGMLTSLVPYVGSVLSFGAPLLALFGIVLGGVGISRAKQHGDSDTFATLGLTLNIIAFLFGLVFALTCGLCNACISQSAQQNARWNLGPTPGSARSTPTPSITTPTIPTGPSGFSPPPLVPTPVLPDPNTTTPSVDPSVDPTGATPTADVPECRTAEACCRAFFDDATPCDESLAAARASSDVADACNQMAREYRAGLTSLDREIPPACR